MTSCVLDASDLLAILLGEPAADPTVPLDAALSYEAGMLRPITLEDGLSRGERCCLALARREGRPALTAERRWPLIAEAAEVTIELIR